MSLEEVIVRYTTSQWLFRTSPGSPLRRSADPASSTSHSLRDSLTSSPTETLTVTEPTPSTKCSSCSTPRT